MLHPPANDQSILIPDIDQLPAKPKTKRKKFKSNEVVKCRSCFKPTQFKNLTRQACAEKLGLPVTEIFDAVVEDENDMTYGTIRSHKTRARVEMQVKVNYRRSGSSKFEPAVYHLKYPSFGSHVQKRHLNKKIGADQCDSRNRSHRSRNYLYNPFL